MFRTCARGCTDWVMTWAMAAPNGFMTGGTSTVVQLLQALVPVVRTVHATVPARQDVPPGVYGDSIVATIAF